MTRIHPSETPPTEVLAHYPALHPTRQISPLGSGGGFSGARLWQVEVEGRKFCLRQIPGNLVLTPRLRGLHRLLAETHSAGITQIPVPLRTADNSTFVACRHCIYQVEPWMPGVADYHQQPNPGRLTAMLSCLAHWHQAATAFRPVGEEGDWFSQTTAGLSPGLADRHNQVRHWTPEALGHLRAKLRGSNWTEFVGLGERVLELFPVVAGRIECELRIARGVRVPLQPCLRDIWHDHLLLTGNEVTGLIDAHACRSDSVATDLSRLLGSLVGDDRSAWNVGLQAYQQVRRLSLEEQALVAVFDRSAVLLGGLVWLTWHCLDGRTFENPQQVCRRLSWIVGRLEHLAQKY